MGLSEISEVLVVGEDLDWKGGAVEVMPEGFEGANNSKEFTVIDVIVSFCL